MKKLVRLVIAAAASVLALAAALALLLLNPPGRGTEAYVFSDRAATEVLSVQIENENGAFDVAVQDGGYLISGVPSELVDIDAFIDFLVACSEVSAKQPVDTGEYDPEAFGLAAPQAVMRASYTDGGALTLRIGKIEPLSGDYYCAVGEDTQVYLIDGETAEKYLAAKESLISFYVTPKLQVSSALSALQDVTFSGGPLEEPVTIESVSAGDEAVKMLARSFGAATHIVRGAGVYELDQTYGLTVLEPLCGMMGQAIVSYGLTPGQEDAMGFSEPYMQAEFDYRNGGEEAVHYVLRFLPAAEDGSLFYVNAAGSGVVYLIERLPFFDLSYEKLLLRWFLSPLLMDVSGITLADGSRSYVFEVDNTDVKNPVVTLNGQPLDVSLFRSFFQLLCSAASDGSYLGPQPEPEDRPQMSVTYRYTQGKADDTLALYPGSGRRVNVFVNGVCEFAMKDTFVERVREALAALGRGDSFDINW